MTTKQRLTRITPLRAGIVLSTFYGLIGLIAAPFLLFAAFTGREGAVSGVVLAVTIPIMYAFGGFVGGILGAALYNLVANWTGGLEFELSDDAPGDPGR